MQLEVGAILEGKVTGITKFGAFVELPEGKTGMVHISEVAPTYVKEIRDYLTENQQVKVKVLSISDEGRGVPVGMHASGKPTPEVIYTVLHAGGKFEEAGYKVSGGLHGVGASVVNALSDWLEVKVYRDGKVYYQRYQTGGKPVEPLKVIGESDKGRTGTTVTFKPDDQIFTETTVYDYDILKIRLRELAFLNRGLRITLYDDREDPKKDSFHYEGGIREYVEMLNKNKNPIMLQLLM